MAGVRLVAAVHLAAGARSVVAARLAVAVRLAADSGDVDCAMTQKGPGRCRGLSQKLLEYPISNAR